MCLPFLRSFALCRRYINKPFLHVFQRKCEKRWIEETSYIAALSSLIIVFTCVFAIVGKNMGSICIEVSNQYKILTLQRLKNVRVLLCPMIYSIPKSTVVFKGPQASPACPSGRAVLRRRWIKVIG